jgi:snapalysin
MFDVPDSLTLRGEPIMLTRTMLGIVAGAALALPLVAAPAATADPVVQAVTITYDDSQAGEFKTAVANGIAVWNSSVTNVRITRAPAGTRANVRVIADDGWPRASLGPVRAGGSGTVFFGRQAVQQGFNTTRIAAHEFGHILGLPDNRTGRCTDLMSGSSAPTSCANATPSSAERSAVQRNYASGLLAQRQNDPAVMVVDAG